MTGHRTVGHLQRGILGNLLLCKGVIRAAIAKLVVALVLFGRKDEAEGVVVAEPQAVVVLELRWALDGLAIDQSPAIASGGDNDFAIRPFDLSMLLDDAHSVELKVGRVLLTVFVCPSDTSDPILEEVDQSLCQATVFMQVPQVRILDCILVHQCSPSQRLLLSCTDVIRSLCAVLVRLGQFLHTLLIGGAHLLGLGLLLL
mmetsp:Transcript_35067/g.58749  ORF Transcript_35067/g.58749 Transcript_35067/m.58749 type:complete len:201 (-) Transcript_35067:1227-1829(-)